jgi:predicted dehydrogenase
MNRRIFLQTSGAAALQAAPSKIRTGFYFMRHSHFGGKWKACLDNPAFEIAGVYEPDATVRAQAKGNFRFISEEELLGDKSIQLVVVEVPPATGLPYGRKVIEAGKHLHIEKPPTDQWAPFRDLVEQARHKKLLLQTGYIWRFHEGIRRAKEAMKQGWLGEVYLMRGTIHTDIAGQLRKDVAGFKGGMMFELGSHQIDRVVDLFGRPKQIKSWLKKTTLGAKDGLADNTLAILEYDGALAVLSTSARMPGATQHRSFEIIGTEGAIVIQPVEPGTKMRVSLREAKGPYRAGWQDIELPPQPRYIGDFQDLARAIQTNTPLTYSYDFELLVHETILRAAGEMPAG